MPDSKMDSFPVRRMATNSGFAFADPVEGITTPSHMAGRFVVLPRQCQLPWGGMGDPHVLWKGMVPMEMLDKVVEALERFNHNSRTCPNGTIDPCKVRGVLTSHGRVSRGQWASEPTEISFPCSCDGRYQSPSA